MLFFLSSSTIVKSSESSWTRTTAFHAVLGTQLWSFLIRSYRTVGFQLGWYVTWPVYPVQVAYELIEEATNSAFEDDNRDNPGASWESAVSPCYLDRFIALGWLLFWNENPVMAGSLANGSTNPSVIFHHQCQDVNTWSDEWRTPISDTSSNTMFCLIFASRHQYSSMEQFQLASTGTVVKRPVHWPFQRLIKTDTDHKVVSYNTERILFQFV